MEDPLKTALRDVITRLKGSTEHPGFLQASETIAKHIENFGGSASRAAKSFIDEDSLSARNILEHYATIGEPEAVKLAPPGSLPQSAKTFGIWRRDDILTRGERKELRRYTGAGCYDLNVALRNDYVTPEHQVRIDAINSALAKLPNYEGVVHRGAQLPAEVLAKYQPGVVVTEKAFTSTSRGLSQAFLGNGNVRYNIFSRYGSPLGRYSQNPWEREVLFGSGSKFLVVRRMEDPRVEEVEIDMIDL
ncbi:ADP-ribosyltransferase [Nocardia sp. NBC_01388]|uniref:ADP-ribosyltransferase n=1 Tax=Nocardia sp. NBC_01388 TaxID=2903596 RepID=UPI003246B8E4